MRQDFPDVREAGFGIGVSTGQFRHQGGRQLVMTLTDELFLPSRIVYRVATREQLLSGFRNLRSMSFDPARNRWVWHYESEARQLGFPIAYDQIPRERRPLVLASCYLVEGGAMHVYVRSALRVCKALVFFDRHIPCAAGARAEYIDEYNLLTAQEPRMPLPEPEDFFTDESRIVFYDTEALMDDRGRLAAELSRIPERTLEPLERHRLTAYYEDGEEHMNGAMRLREILAMKQYLSDTPIKPYQALREFFETARPALSIEAGRVPFMETMPRAEAGDDARPEPPVEETPFSFIKAVPGGDGMIVEFGRADSMDRYSAAIGCCDNPACDCRAVQLRLTPLGEAPATDGIRFRLLIDDKVIQSPHGFRGMGEALSTRFTENDWSAAGRVYAEMKAEISEPADASGLDMSFPDEVLKDPSLLVAYQEVFQYARDLHLPHERKLWIVRERYCSNPACSCADIVLDFVRPPDEIPPGGRVIPRKDVSTGFFNYRTGALKAEQEWPSDSPRARELMAALQSACPDFADRFERRHRVLRTLHRRARDKSRSAVQRRERIGRNEPCPCGSGKKYKLCCGR